MRKLIGIALALAVVLTLGLSTAVLADDPTTVEVDWDNGAGGFASGWVGATVDAGDDATMAFETAGNGIRGSFRAEDTNNESTPFTYMGVDSCLTYLNAEVSGGGFIEYQTDRTDSYEGSYGPSGQQSYSFLEALGASSYGSMAMGSSTNYASQKDCCFSSTGTKMGLPNKLNGHHYTVSGATAYTIDKYIQAGDGDWAEVLTQGIGLAELDCMNSEMSGGQVRLGRGCGCYTDADFHAVGDGNFLATAHGNNYAEIYATGANSYGSSASVGIISSWVGGGCDISDYSMFAN